MDQQPPADRDPSEEGGSPQVCYRHPDRSAGIRCTRCERPICTACMVSASVGFQCPECVRNAAGTGHHPAASRPRTLTGGTVSADPHLVTKILLAVNVAVFAAVWLTGRSWLVEDLMMLGRAWDPQPFPGAWVGVAEGQWYRLLTSVFLHEELLHIAFNMLGLWWLGGPLEAALGRIRFLALYLLSGLAGSAVTYWMSAQNQGSLGASGAVFGLLGATVVLMRRMNYDLRPALVILALNVLFSLRPGVAWQAHLGGLVAGTLIAVALVHAPRTRRIAVQCGACALVLVVTAVIVLARTAVLT
ncbi:rhomboid family intramembrane serine protease [Streptomyces sp. AM 2-1-1]|uniref:rhomboid family intramembrane serine protease n=1 Tax=Streptomyces sp. AM 2-1-1 TaxID=3028709 RepID=UPI0023B98FCB|nr:rhomboid family intramembrane serine protease [Streptomyces sp. AM 2-1-1]WEH40739.1 rhomboid family intramembrane serine protease [Streptomyces sp. AM 2-1-1]